MFVPVRKFSTSCFTSTGPTCRETLDRLAVKSWPSLREIRRVDAVRIIIARPGNQGPIATGHVAIRIVGVRVGAAPGLRHLVLVRRVIGPRRSAGNVTARGDVPHPRRIVGETQVRRAIQRRMAQPIHGVVVEILREAQVVILPLRQVALAIAAPATSYSIKIFRPRKNQELLLPSASDCAWGRSIAKHQRRRLDEEPLAGFNQSAGPSTYPRRISVRTTRATAGSSGLSNLLCGANWDIFGGTTIEI